MIEAAGAFDGWGSSLIGGLVGAGFVVFGVWFAQHLQDKRRAVASRREAADGLVVEISNARDAAAGRRTGMSGAYQLYPLRNRLFVAHSVLYGLPVYNEVNAFYLTLFAWRDWARTHSPPAGERWPDELWDQLETYRCQIRRYGEEVIALLHSQLENRDLHFARPQLPELPD